MIHLPLPNHELTDRPVSRRHASRRDDDPPQRLLSTIQHGGIDRCAHENIADAVGDGESVHGLLRGGRGFLGGTLGAGCGVRELEEGEGFGRVDEPEEAKADEDGSVEQRWD